MEIVTEYNEMLKQGAWLQIDEDLEYLERKGWQPPVEHFGDKICGNEFTLLLGYYSPLSPEERVRVLLEENEGLNNIFRSNFFKKKGKVEIEHYKEMISNFLQIPFDKKDEIQSKIDSEDESEKIKNARLMWAKSKWGPSSYWGLTLEQAVCLHELPPLPEGQAYDFAFHMLLTYIWQFAGTKEQVEDLLETLGGDGGGVGLWLEPWEMTYRYLWAAKIIYQNNTSTFSPVALEPAQPQETSRNLTESQGTSNNAASPLAQSELIESSNVLTDRLLKDFSITDALNYSFLRENIYYLFYELQKTLGAVINRRDYSFILDMLVWEDELAIAGKSLPDGYLSQERELYINLNSEIARQVRRWIAERRFEIHSDKTTLETFLQFNYDGLIANYIHRLYYHITHQYTDTFHLENMALAIDQFYKNLERVGVEHADRFINRPLKKNLYLYGSIRHTLGIGDIDVGIYNPEWNKEKGILRLSDSDSVDLWLWKGEPNESAVKLPEVLTDAKQAKNLARFIYGIRLVQREFMRRGLAVPIVAVGQLAAIRWADERKVNEADVSAIIKADLVTVRQVAEFINGASVERMLNDPGLGIFDKAAGRLNEINAQRKHFRENINIDAKAADAVRLRKLATFDAFMQSPFFEVNEKGYFAERKKLIEDLLSTKSVVASIPSSSEISASSLKGKVKAFDGSPAELEPEKSIEELKAELNDLIDKYPDPQWKRFAITIFEDLIDRKRNEREYLKLLIIVTKLPLGDPSRDCQVLYSLLNTYADGVNRLKLLQDIVYAVKPMSEKRNLENSLKFISQLFASGLYEPSELNDIRQLIDKIDAISEESYEYELRKSKEMNRRFGDDAADILIQYHDLYSILDLLTVLVQTGLIFDRGILLTYTEQIIKIVQKALRIEKEPYYEAFTFPDEVLGIFDNLLIYRPITSEELADIASLPNSKFLAQVDELRKEFFRGWEDGRGGWRSLGLRKSGRAYSWKDSQWYQYYRERKGGAQISIGVPSDEIRSNYDKLVKLGRQDEAATTLIRLVRMVLEGRGDLQQDMIFDTLKEFFGVKVFEKKEILKNIVRVHPEHKEIFSQGLQGSAKQVAPILFSVYDCVDRLDNNASSLDVYNSVKNDLVEALNRAIEIMNEWVRDAPFPADSKNALQSASVGKELKLTGSSPLEQGIRKVLKQIEATVFSPSDITTFRQCRVYRNSGLKVIVKELIDNVIPDGPRAGYYFKKKALKGYQLAQQRLGGLVVPFTIVDLQLNVENADAISQTSINSAVILKKVKDHDLTDKIKYLARQRRIEEIKELVRIVFKMDHEMMKRGCYLPDPILENFGILENGTIVLIDPGFLVSDDTIDNQVIASDWFLRGKSHHLNNIFLNSLKEESGLSDEEIKEIKMAYGEASGVYPDEFDDKYFDFFETFIKHERYYARGEQEFKEFYHSCKPGDEIPVVFLTSSPVAEDLEPVVITDDRESRTDNQKSNKGASPVLISDIEPIRRAYRPFENKADIREFVEGPLIEACTIFYEAGIETIFTSANKEDLKRINRRGDGGRYAYLEIKYDGNKYKYMDTAGSRWAYGGIKIDIENVPFSDHMKSAKIYIPISGQTTAEELSRKAVEIAKSFYKNDVKDVSASSIGGIDMRDLVKHTLIKKQGQGSFGSIGDFSNNRELEEIQRMIQAGIIPSTNRLEECQKSCQAEALISCIADILRMEEERVTATEAGIKQLLVNLESG